MKNDYQVMVNSNFDPDLYEWAEGKHKNEKSLYAKGNCPEEICYEPTWTLNLKDSGEIDQAYICAGVIAGTCKKAVKK